MVGGLLRRYMEIRNFADAAERTNCVQSGVLYSSGLIAGEGLIGILLAILAVMDLDLDMSKTINLGNVEPCRLCPSCGDHLRSLPEGPEILSLILSVGCQAADYRNQSLDFEKAHEKGKKKTTWTGFPAIPAGIDGPGMKGALLRFMSCIVAFSPAWPRIFNRPSVSHIDLDAFGSALWLSMDGKKNVGTLLR